MDVSYALLKVAIRVLHTWHTKQKEKMIEVTGFLVIILMYYVFLSGQ